MNTASLPFLIVLALYLSLFYTNTTGSAYNAVSTSANDVWITNDDDEGEEGDDDDDEEEMPKELAGLDPAEQQRRLLSMSLSTMFLGTALVVLFSDPMTDVLGGNALLAFTDGFRSFAMR